MMTVWLQCVFENEVWLWAGDFGLILLWRLNNVEYVNTICDLIGVDLWLTCYFLVDGAVGEGFLNVVDLLVVSSDLMSCYLIVVK